MHQMHCKSFTMQLIPSHFIVSDVICYIKWTQSLQSEVCNYRIFMSTLDNSDCLAMLRSPIIDILLPLAICRSLVVNTACRERELTAREEALGTDVSVTDGASVSTAGTSLTEFE